MLNGSLHFLVAAALALAGCVQFPGDQLPKVPEDSLRRSRIAAMDYKLDVRSGDEHYPELVPIYGIIFASKAERVFADVKRDGTAAPLHLGVVLDTSPMSTGTEVWLGFSSLTLYVLPVRREIVYSLAVSATWHGQPLKTYRYEDSANRWVGLFFLPLMPFDRYSKDRELDLIRNLETTFFADLSRDLEAVAPTPVSTPR